jgi:2'-5' RNA ligase
MLRAFFAVEPEPPAREALGELARRLDRDASGVRWVATGNLHVTLRFLGPTEPEAVPRLLASVGERLASLPPFALGFGAPRLFPSPRRPRVVAVALAPEAPLARLAGEVEQGVVAAGLPAEARLFRAHLTLGRVRGGRPRLRLPDAFEAPPFQVREAVLFESRLDPAGARYTPLGRLALGGHASPDEKPEGERHGKD